MLLSDLLAEGAEDVEVGALAYDNRRVAPGTLFFCVPGFTRDGHDFAPDAVARGAVALVVARPLGLGVPEVEVADVRAAMARAAARFHGDPTARLPVAGITGTNGKTTTAFILRSLLEAAGRRCGLLGTVKSVVAGEERAVQRTTPEAIDLQAIFAEMLAGGDAACAMEVSSHALELRRADGIHFAVAVFTNLTQDHLDFHPDMEAYFQAKRLLFAAGPGARVANADDAFGRRLAGEFAGTVTFGTAPEADYRAVGVRGSPAGSAFTVRSPDGEHGTSVPLPGAFNVLNALGAWAAARVLGVEPGDLARGLPRAGAVPGRFEPVDAGQPFAVLVDYAHTPDSLENVLRAARRAGGRPRHRRLRLRRRPRPGQAPADGRDRRAAGRPRRRDLRQPAHRGPGGDPRRDRRGRRAARRPAPGSSARWTAGAAIARAVGLAEAGDVVVIAGKGHEQGQELAGGRKVPFDDVAVAREALAARAGTVRA